MPLQPDMSSEQTTRIRERRGERRKIAHLQEAKLCRNNSETFLTINQIRPSTAAAYNQAVQPVLKWVEVNGIDITFGDPMERALAEYFEDLYFEGYAAGSASRLLAALEHMHPSMKSKGVHDAVQARTALRGFRRLVPEQSRAPLPLVALYAMIGAALHSQDRIFAIMLLIAYCGYLRPSELLGIRGRQLIPPVAGAMTRTWAILLAPSYQAVPSKTQAFDESVLLDWAVFEKIHPLLLGLSRAGDQFIWHMPYTVFLQKFHRYAEISGVQAALKPHPYAMRHGGASSDCLLERRTLAQIKARGRWRADSSVRRYEKHARLLAQVKLIPLEVRVYGLLIEKHLVQMVLRKRDAPRPPAWSQGRGNAQLM